MTRSYLRIFALLAGLPFLASFAQSQCVDPPSPSVVICTPSPDSTVVYIPDIAVRFTPANGAQIAGITIYDNGQVISQTGQGQDGGDLYDAAIFDGTHHLVVKASDTAGNSYKASETYHVVGQGYPFCKVPDKPGVNFCIPPKNAFLGVQFTLGAAARGQSKITSLCFYLDGVLQQTCDNDASGVIPATVPQQGVEHTAKVVATDSDGNQYSASKKVEAQYTYGQYSCSYTCPPGINVIAPVDEEYVQDSFNLDMQIMGNTNPITSMTAYLDNKEIATSDGATLQQQITGAPQGTHILTVSGVDSQGLVYWLQENVNIDISK